MLNNKVWNYLGNFSFIKPFSTFFSSWRFSNNFSFTLRCLVVNLPFFLNFSFALSFKYALISVFYSIFDLPKNIIPYAQESLQILFLIPGLTLFICFMRSVFIASRKTIFVTYSSLCEVATVSLSLIMFTQLTNFYGALCIVLSLVLGRISACSICTYLKIKHLRKLGKKKEQILVIPAV